MIFEGYTPPVLVPPDVVRFTQARIEQGTSVDGPWTTIEPAFNLSPAITDDANPPTYTWNTDGATGDEGWFRVVWMRSGAPEVPTQPVHLVAMSPYAPTVGDVANRMRTNLRTLGGGLASSFTDDTIPTAAQVHELIREDFPIVLMEVGDVDGLVCANAAQIQNALRGVAAERIALRVLETYLLDEISDLNLEPRWERADARLAAIVTAAATCRAEGSPTPDPGSTGVNDAAWSFPRVPYLNW